MFEFLRNALRPNADSVPSAGASRARGLTAGDRPYRRRSNGLKHFFDTIPNSSPLEVLDLGGLNEANINFLSQRGGKIHAVDLLDRFDSRKLEKPQEPMDASRARDFVDEYLNFARNQFDAVLVWDVLEFLDSDLLYAMVPRLGEVVRPGGALLTFFHTQGRGESVPVHRYRIADFDTLVLQPSCERTLPNTFNNRSLERLFADFEAVKFFLTRDNLREVIISR